MGVPPPGGAAAPPTAPPEATQSHKGMPPPDVAPLSVPIAALSDVAFTVGMHLRSLTLRARAPNAPITRPPQPPGPPGGATRNVQKLVAVIRVFCDAVALTGFELVAVDLQPFARSREGRMERRWRAEVIIVDEAE